MMMERYPNLKEEVGSSIPGYENLLSTCQKNSPGGQLNVQGEPVFNVMVAGGLVHWSGKVEDVKLVLLKKTGFQPAIILRRRIFARMNCEIGGFHLVWFIQGRISVGSRV
jgi:hypothetical protein